MVAEAGVIGRPNWDDGLAGPLHFSRGSQGHSMWPPGVVSPHGLFSREARLFKMVPKGGHCKT